MMSSEENKTAIDETRQVVIPIHKVLIQSTFWFMYAPMISRPKI